MHTAVDLDGMVDLSPFHRVKSHHSLTTNRNESIIWQDGNIGGAPWVSPLFDNFVRFNVPHYDLPIVVTADDLGPIPCHSKTTYIARVLH